MVDEAKLRSPIHSTFGTLVVRYVVGCCCREESGPFCWSVLAAGIEFLVHLIDLLRIHLWSNGFTRIQKAVVDQTSKQWPWPTFCCKVGFGKCFGVSSQSSDIGGHCSLSYKFPFLLHTTIQSRNVSLLPERLRKDETSKQWFFFFFDLQSAHEASTYWAFSLSSLLQIPNNCRMVDVEFLGNFSCSCKSISIDDALGW